jgi:tetratricopeptide (TPR) repeat protein
MRRDLVVAVRLLSLVALLAPFGGCVRPRLPALPAGHVYVYPSWPPRELSREQSTQMQRAWRDILAGKVGAAEKRLRRLLQERPGYGPARTALAFARLRAGRLAEARAGFGRVLTEAPDYYPALVGAGAAAQADGDPVVALDHYKRAEMVRPGDARVQGRLAEAKLQVTERSVAAARAAQDRGELETAITLYRRALHAAPELGALRIELAGLLVSQGDPDAASALLEQDPTEDLAVLTRLGALYSEQGEHARALRTYRRLLEKSPGDSEAMALAESARKAYEMSRMPEEYRRIPDAERINRADLAALVSLKITALSRVPTGEPAVAVDISGSWAREQIINVLAHGIMTVYPNHTFQPGATVRRGDVAVAVARVLDRLGQPSPGPAPKISDMSSNNLLYGAVTRAVAAGLLDLTPGAAFEPWRPVSGRRAIEIMDALARLVGP